MSNKDSKITIDVGLDEQMMPTKIEWMATQSDIQTPQEAKAMMVGFWDGKERSALRIDLWTTAMKMDEMNDFFYQSFKGMANTYGKANTNPEIAKMINDFADEFYKKSMDAIK